MSNRASVKSAFENLRPTILREPARSEVSPEAEARLLETTVNNVVTPTATILEDGTVAKAPYAPTVLLQKKKREHHLLVSFRMPHTLKEKLEYAAKKHEINQTDIINEAIELNLRRYL